MVMFAQVLTVGPFKQELLPHYEYPAQHYASMRAGSPIVRILFGIGEGTHAGTAFALALGITDPWDFNQHKIDPSAINFEDLRRVLTGLAGWNEEYSDDFETLRVFANADYDLYFLPNA